MLSEEGGEKSVKDFKAFEWDEMEREKEREWYD
jgi:hypothetical protein